MSTAGIDHLIDVYDENAVMQRGNCDVLTIRDPVFIMPETPISQEEQLQLFDYIHGRMADLYYRRSIYDTTQDPAIRRTLWIEIDLAQRSLDWIIYDNGYVLETALFDENRREKAMTVLSTILSKGCGSFNALVPAGAIMNRNMNAIAQWANAYAVPLDTTALRAAEVLNCFAKTRYINGSEKAENFLTTLAETVDNRIYETDYTSLDNNKGLLRYAIDYGNPAIRASLLRKVSTLVWANRDSEMIRLEDSWKEEYHGDQLLVYLFNTLTSSDSIDWVYKCGKEILCGRYNISETVVDDIYLTLRNCSVSVKDVSAQISGHVLVNTLAVIRCLEEESPGCVERLYNRFGIKVFCRYPPDLLLEQDRLWDDLNQNPERATELDWGISIGTFADHNEAFLGDYDKNNQFYLQLRKSPPGFAKTVWFIVEGGHFSEIDERVRSLLGIMKKQAQCGILSGHGFPSGIQTRSEEEFFAKLDNDILIAQVATGRLGRRHEYCYLNCSHAKGVLGALFKAVIVPDGELALMSCSTGSNIGSEEETGLIDRGEPGFAQLLSQSSMLRVHAPISPVPTPSFLPEWDDEQNRLRLKVDYCDSHTGKDVGAMFHKGTRITAQSMA